MILGNYKTITKYNNISQRFVKLRYFTMLMERYFDDIFGLLPQLYQCESDMIYRIPPIYALRKSELYIHRKIYR